MPRPMYFLAIETTSRRLADVSCSRPSRPMRTSTPRRSRGLSDGSCSGVPAHLGHELGVLAADDPAPQRLVADLARPVVELRAGAVLSWASGRRVNGAGRRSRPARGSCRRRARRCTPRPRALGFLERTSWSGRPRPSCRALTKWKSGVGWSSPSFSGRRERAAHDAVGLVLVRQPVLRELGARLLLGLVLASTPTARGRPSAARRRSARRARSPWPGRPLPRR